MLLADDETAPIVREMFEMVADGATLHYVATTLNERGVASPGRRLYETGVSKKDKYKNSMWYMPVSYTHLIGKAGEHDRLIPIQL